MDKGDVAISLMKKRQINPQTSGDEWGRESTSGVTDADFSKQQLIVANVVQTEKKISGTSEECLINSSKLTQRRGGINISLEQLIRVGGMKRKEAAQNLNVSVSTFKRICRDYDINRWPPRNRNIDQHSCSTNSAQTTCTEELGETAPAEKTENLVTIKAKYTDKFIKFHLSVSSGIDALHHQVSKRLELEAKDYTVSYRDEDGDLILLKCDEDLQYYYVSSLTRQGSDTLTVFIEPN